MKNNYLQMNTKLNILVLFLFFAIAFHSEKALAQKIAKVQDECPPSAPCTGNTDTLVAVPYPNRVSIKVGGYWRVVTSNGIPDHTIGIFPLPNCGRPDSIKEQHHVFVMPAYPGHPTYRLYHLDLMAHTEVPEFTPFGIAINGIPLDPEAAEWWKCNRTSGWQSNPIINPDMDGDLDSNNGHIQPPDTIYYKSYDNFYQTNDNNFLDNGGAYHYHALPNALYEKQGGTYPWNSSPLPKVAETILLGWAFDGAPIYGPTCFIKNAKKGSNNWWEPESNWEIKWRWRRLSTVPLTEVPSKLYYPFGSFVQDYKFVSKTYNADFPPLDECNGHFSPTPEYQDGIYHYHITMDFPYIPRCYTVLYSIDGPTKIEIK
jgi:hypothetical protein